MTSAVRRTAPGVLAGTLLVLVALLAPLIGTSAAQAQQEGPDPEVRLRVTDLSTVLGPGTVPVEDGPWDSDRPEVPEDLDLRVLVENVAEEPVEGLRLVVEVHPAVTDREALHTALDDGDVPGPPLYVRDEPIRDLGAIEPGSVAGRQEQIESGSFPFADESGVHPVRLAVVRGAQVLDEVVTGVVWLPEAPAQPLLTTMVWPLDEPPWRTTRGRYPATAQREIRPGGRLDVLLRGLERHSGAGVLLSPAAHLLEDLRDQAGGFVEVSREPDGTQAAVEVEPEDTAARLANDTLERVRQVAEDLPHGPVTGPYADADLAALAGRDQAMRELGGELATAGRQRLQGLVNRVPDTSTIVVHEHVDEAALDLLPVDHLLVPPGLVEDPDVGGLGSLRSPSGRLLTATVGDPRLTELLADPAGGHGPLVAAQRVVVESAGHWLEDPDAEGRTLGIHPPSRWSPDADLVDALLQGLDDAAWLDLVTPAVQASGGERSPTRLELVPPEGDRLSASLADDIETALLDLDSVRRAQPDEVEEQPPRARSFGDLRDAVLRATSHWYGGGSEAEALVRDVQREVDRAFGDVEVASGSRVTLTAESGQIPITLRRTRGTPITVRVEVASQGRLVWPEGRQSEELVLSDREAHTVSFQTRALSMGTFPVTVRVTDPSGERELERTTLSVRSTRVSGAALTATGGVVLVLLIAGSLRRRPRRPALAVVDSDPAVERRY